MKNAPVLIPLNGYTKVVEGPHDLTPPERLYICVRYIEEFRPKNGAEPLSASDVIEIVSDVTGVPVLHMSKQVRDAKIVHARHLAIYFITLLVQGMSLKAIGSLLGGRDHTTVIHARNKVRDLLDVKDDRTVRDAERIEALLKSRLTNRDDDTDERSEL